MTDPFVRALAALYASPLAVDAIFDPNGAAKPIRLIRSRPSEDLSLNGVIVAAGSNLVSFQLSDVPAPRGGRLAIGLDVFRITGVPRIDAEGLEWSCEIQAA